MSPDRGFVGCHHEEHILAGGIHRCGVRQQAGFDHVHRRLGFPARPGEILGVERLPVAGDEHTGGGASPEHMHRHVTERR
jgi:hypothetical protein